MDSRQRVAAAVDHRRPDRVPVDYWACGQVTAALLARLGLADRAHLLDRLDVDFRYIDGPRYVGPPLVRPDGAPTDHWGVGRVTVDVPAGQSGGSYEEVVEFPLASAATLDDLKSYPHWPSPDWFDYAVVADQVRAARATGRAVVFMGDRTNRCAQLKPAMYLRGVEQILLDMALAPEMAQYLFDRISEFYVEYATRTLAAARPAGGVEILFTGDDFGSQTGPMVSPAMWNRQLRAGFAAMLAVGKRFGCKVAHHSCGSIRPLIGPMIDCGLDILNPIQPEAADMDPAELKRQFGKDLCFHGSISIQQTLPHGTPEQIRAEVADRVAALADDGGFIFCSAHNIQADTPVENVLALFEAYRELGRY